MLQKSLIANLLPFIVISMTVSNAYMTSASFGKCSCNFEGHQYNFKSLARLEGKPRFTLETKGGWFYGYNPCLPFSIGKCQDVAICHWDKYYQSFNPLGIQTNMKCEFETSGEIVKLVYTIPKSQHWTTTIQCKCNQKRSGVDDGKFTVISDTSNPVLEIEHKCCCPDACPDVLPTPAPSKKEKKKNATGPIVEGAIGGTVGIIFLACLVFCCRRRRQNRLHEENRPLIVHPPDPNAVAQNPLYNVQNLDDDAQNPEDGEGNPEDDERDPEVDEGNPEDDERDPEDDEGDTEDDEGNHGDDERNPEDDEGNPGDDEGDPEDDEGNPEDDEGDPEDDEGNPEDDDGHPEDDVENPDDNGAGNREDNSGNPEDDAGNPEDGAGNPEDGVGNSEGGAGNPDDRAGSPHIANIIPYVPETRLSSPIAVSDPNQDHSCVEDSGISPREAVEHSPIDPDQDHFFEEDPHPPPNEPVEHSFLPN